MAIRTHWSQLKLRIIDVAQRRTIDSNKDPTKMSYEELQRRQTINEAKRRILKNDQEVRKTMTIKEYRVIARRYNLKKEWKNYFDAPKSVIGT